MEAHLKKITAVIGQLSTEAQAALKTISKTKKYNKGEYLLRQDEVCRCSYWIETGILRKFYISEQKEITTELLFEKDLAVSFTSYALQTPSREFIQAVTDTTVSKTDYEAFALAKNKFPQLLELDLLLSEYYTMWLEQRLFEFHTLDAKGRYLALMQHNPKVIQTIPLTYIASYLGISLETLSRIRARI